jgi:hypothetical protein
MRCKRCQGLIVVDPYANEDVKSSMSRFWAWRCINCGATMDVVTLRNLAAHRSHLLKVSVAIVERRGRSRLGRPAKLRPASGD